MALLGSLIGAGTSLLGSAIAGRQERRATSDAMAAGRRFVSPELQASFGAAGRAGDAELARFQELPTGDPRVLGRDLPSLEHLTRLETQRLGSLRAPGIAQARSRLQSQLLGRGRLGLGAGGGRTGNLFNPETAALEEAILQAQLGDIGAGRAFAERERGFINQFQLGERAFGVNERQRALANARGLFQTASGGIEQPNAGLAAMQAQPGFNMARTTRGFFSGLGSQLETGGFFNRPGGEPQQIPLTGAGLL